MVETTPEKKIIFLDPTSMKELNCHQKFSFMNLNGYRSKTNNPKLEFGSAVHIALAERQKGRSMLESQTEALKYFFEKCPTVPESEYRNAGYLAQTLARYFSYYSFDPFTPLKNSEGHAVELPFKIPYKSYPDIDVLLCGVIDSVGMISGRLCIKDIKTTSAYNIREYLDAYASSVQMLTYSLALKLLGLVDYYAPIMIDGIFLRAKKEAQFVRSDLLDVNVHYMESFLSWLNTEIESLVEAVRTNTYKKNFTFCHASFGECAYYKPCMAQPAFQQNILDSFYTIKVYDPSTFHE